MKGGAGEQALLSLPRQTAVVRGCMIRCITQKWLAKERAEISHPGSLERRSSPAEGAGAAGEFRAEGSWLLVTDG